MLTFSILIFYKISYLYFKREHKNDPKIIIDFEKNSFDIFFHFSRNCHFFIKKKVFYNISRIKKLSWVELRSQISQVNIFCWIQHDLNNYLIKQKFDDKFFISKVKILEKGFDNILF